MVMEVKDAFQNRFGFYSFAGDDREAISIDMIDAFEHHFHGIQFDIPDDSYYDTQDGLSWEINPTYTHSWNSSGESEVKIQISRRETPTLTQGRNIGSANRAILGYYHSPPSRSTASHCQVVAEKDYVYLLSAEQGL